jgi:hypothetical protein
MRREIMLFATPAPGVAEPGSGLDGAVADAQACTAVRSSAGRSTR